MRVFGILAVILSMIVVGCSGDDNNENNNNDTTGTGNVGNKIWYGKIDESWYSSVKEQLDDEDRSKLSWLDKNSFYIKNAEE
jgi:hypothetical protein